MRQLLRQHLDNSPGGCEGVSADDVSEVLLNFYDDPYALHCHRKWLSKALKVPPSVRAELDSLRTYVHEQFQQMVENFLLDVRNHNIIQAVCSTFPLHMVAACALQHGLLRKHAPKVKRAEVRDAPILRKHCNAMGKLGKSYLPAEQVGESSELATNKFPAFSTRQIDGAEQPALESTVAKLPVASPPVMCWLCGEGFTHTGALVTHCKEKHGDYPEYRKRLLWMAQQEGLKPLLPWVKRHIVQSASFFLTYSVPSTMCIGWRNPDSLTLAKPRCEVGCEVLRSQRLVGEPLSSVLVERGNRFETYRRDSSCRWIGLNAASGS